MNFGARCVHFLIVQCLHSLWNRIHIFRTYSDFLDRSRSLYEKIRMTSDSIPGGPRAKQISSNVTYSISRNPKKQLLLWKSQERNPGSSSLLTYVKSELAYSWFLVGKCQCIQQCRLTHDVRKSTKTEGHLLINYWYLYMKRTQQ